MNISEVIRRKKAEFFVEKNDKDLRAQKEMLTKQRESMEATHKLQQDVIAEQDKIREIRKAKGPAQKFVKVLQKFKEANKDSRARAAENRSRMMGQASGPFSVDNINIGGPFFSKDHLTNTGPGPFAGRDVIGPGPFNKPAPKAPEPKARTITIKLRE